MKLTLPGLLVYQSQLAEYARRARGRRRRIARETSAQVAELIDAYREREAADIRFAERRDAALRRINGLYREHEKLKGTKRHERKTHDQTIKGRQGRA